MCELRHTQVQLAGLIQSGRRPEGLRVLRPGGIAMMTELETILSIDYKTLVLISMAAAVLGISLRAIALGLGSKTPSARSHPLIALKGFAVIALIVAGVGV